MKFNVKIAEIETGKVLLDQDSNAIIAGIDAGEGTKVLTLSSCNAATLLATIDGTEKAVEKVLKTNPDVGVIYAFGKLNKVMEEFKAKEGATDES